MTIFINDIFKIFDIDQNQLNVNAVKSLIVALKSYGLCYLEKQKLVFDDELFLECWNIYLQYLNFFDPNYNRKTDFTSFFKYILDYKINNNQINFHALFCPGYTRFGYKDHLGDTTTTKLKLLSDLKNFMDNQLKMSNSITCYYSDVFLENCDVTLNKNWHDELNYNRQLFHEEGEKYFDSSFVKNASDIDIFQKEKDLPGFVDDNIVSHIPPTTYSAFIKNNQKFYSSLGFSKEQIKYRNDRLITMYHILSNYFNALDNCVFLPMENMYERENIFSENNTCTMYLKLKKEDNYGSKK